MSKTYAIADLHGRLDLLEMALAQIANHAELPATLVDDRFHETDHGTGNLLAWIPRLWLIERGAASWQDGGKRSRWR